MPEISKLSADELLRHYLNMPLGENYAQFLDLLIENHALPSIKKSLRSKFYEASSRGIYYSAQDFEDLCSESCLRLVEKIFVLKNESNGRQIGDFGSYAAVVAYNVWNEFLNDGAPNRKSLKNKIRYAFGKSELLEIWKENGELYGGLMVRERRIKQISIEDLVSRVEEEFSGFRNAALPDLIVVILEKASAGLKIKEIVAIVARIWAIEDANDVVLDDFQTNVSSAKSYRRNDFEMRFDLEQIWREIRDLPVNQRIALLYNLRDEHGREMLFMFFNAKIATLREIGEAMNLSLEDCAKILPLLPLEDKIIAEKMSLTIKQVGNLRKVARENLRRRLDGKQKRRKREENNGK